MEYYFLSGPVDKEGKPMIMIIDVAIPRDTRICDKEQEKIEK